ncbi:MAG: GntR family transcriptional regulator [Proteobacteria bacterium]|nr:GntR family transcriptional regulator [Pseudomonadota bacterium]
MALDLRPGERVYQEIKQAILSGEFALLERLDIDRLASQLGVSATPVRYALAILASERLVRVQASRTYHVVFWSERDLRALYEFRQGLALWTADAYEPAPSTAAFVKNGSYVSAYLAVMKNLETSANPELRRAARAADDRLHAALRAEAEALPDASSDLIRIAAALPKGGRPLKAALRKHFRRRIGQCASIRSAAHARAMPQDE